MITHCSVSPGGDSIARSLAWRRLASALFHDAGEGRGDAAGDGGDGLAAPVRLGAYTITGVLGRGAMGTVFQARDEALARDVAIKRLDVDAPAGPEARARVLGEARALACLSHPAIVTVHAVIEHEGRAYIVMERVVGTPLRAWQTAARAGRDGWRDVLEVYLQIARGLQAAHDRGLVHRDLKPENVIVSEGPRARILDFGLARARDGAREIAGTPAYMAPEQAAGASPDPSMDQYSLSVALYEALHGVRPRDDPAARALRGDVPMAISAALVFGCVPDPARRWPSVRALALELERAAVTTEAQRERLLLLDRVEDAWLDAGDDRSPPLEPLALMTRPRPGAVSAWREGAGAADGSLLILGAPGSGKTTALLERARTALRRARVDPHAPAPVVLSLSSWTHADATDFAGWVTGELRDKLGIPVRLTTPWLERGALTLLLDGLDELGRWPARQRACVLALNELRARQLAPVIVTCRVDDYTRMIASGPKLRLDEAVELLPPEPARALTVLERAGESLAGLRAAAAADAELRALLTGSPLVLDTAARAFRGRAPEAVLRELRAGDDPRARVWSAYLDRMFEERAAGPSRAETLRVLTWLARQLHARGETELWIERIQPSWLSGRPARALASALALALAAGGAALIVLVTLGPAISGSIAGLTAALVGPTMALFVALVLGTRRVEPVERLMWSWGHVRAGAGRALRRGLGLSLVIAAIAALSWARGESLSFALAVFVANALAYAPLFSLTFVVLGGLVGAAAPAGASGAAGGRARRVLANQGIRNSLRNFGLVAGLVTLTLALPLVGVTVALGAPAVPGELAADGALQTGVAREAIAAWRARPLLFLLAIELCAALSLGYVAGLLRGGFAALQHCTLRVLLAAGGRAPLRLAALLDSACARALLRPIGGGYQFIHVTLLEHLANEEHSASPVARGQGDDASSAASSRS